MARLTIGPTQTMFVIHADLLCANSPFFRQKLQPQRRAIEGDCSICHEEILLGHKETTFCKSCGANIHHHCIEQWKTRTAEGQVTSCPLCRQDWVDHRVAQNHTFLGIHEDAFEVYIEWLYRGAIAVDNGPDEEPSHSTIDNLIQAYLLGLHAEDWKFCDAVLGSLVEVFVEHDLYPSEELVALAYQRTSGPCRLRRFLVGVLMHVSHTRWMEDESWTEYPAAFIRDVALAALKKSPADEDSWDEDTMKARLCTPGGHAGEGDATQVA